METTFAEDQSGGVAESVGRQVLSLAGDAFYLAATALRLAVLPSRDSKSDLREVSLKEVAFHDSADDCWIVIHDVVYDVTSFLNQHPGGMDVLLEYAGRDASIAFRSVNHSPQALDAIQNHIVGQLPLRERIFIKK